MGYSASMVSCLFWFQETRKTTEMMLQGQTLAEIRAKAVEENLYQVKAPERASRIAGVTYKRMVALPETLRRQFVSTDLKTAKLILLLSMMKTDLLFYEFMHSTFRQSVILGDKKLPDQATAIFFDRMIAQHAEVAAFSESAVKKLKQIYIKVLVDASVLSSAKERLILQPMIDYRLQNAVRQAAMMPYLSTLTGEDCDE